MTQPKAGDARSPGVIRADESYTVTEFRRRTGIGDYAFRELRAAGFTIVKVGKKRYVLGETWLAFLRQQASNQ